MSKEDIINKQLQHLQRPPFDSAVKYFLETGNINGSFLSAIMLAMDEYEVEKTSLMEEKVKGLREFIEGKINHLESIELTKFGVLGEMKKKLLVSFSGGETSAYMAQWLWKNKQDEFEMIFVFANTGQENEETLRFVEHCSNFFGFRVIWIEAVPRVNLFGKIVEMCNDVFDTNWTGGIGTTFKKVSFLTASRDGEPFEKIIQKYGIPNMSTPHCTRELKQQPIKAYARSIGWKDYYLAIGIRTDEIDRMNPKRKEMKLIYPLVEMREMTKPKINFWWSQQPFRLELKGYQGNCITCWKKGDNKLFQIANEGEYNFNFFAKMELRYEKYVPESVKRIMEYEGKVPNLPARFFKKNRSVSDILQESKKLDKQIIDDSKIYDRQPTLLEAISEDDIDDTNGSCEVFSECSNG